MLTRAGWLVTAAGLATLAAGRAFAIDELFVAGATMLVLVAVALIWVRRPVAAVRAARHVRPLRAHLGSRCQVELHATNPTTRRSPVLALIDPVEGTVGAHFTLPPLRAGDAHDLAYRLPTDRRGRRAVGPLRAELSDPFGLARRNTQIADAAVVIVLPRVEPLARVPMGGGRDEPLAGIARRGSTSSSTDDFASLRPYHVGDDLRRVHWPSSARAGDLLVRQDDLRWQGHVTVVLETREDRVDPASFERAVSAAASVVHAVDRSGDRIRLLMADGTDSGMIVAGAADSPLLEHLALATRAADGTFPVLPTDGRRHSGTLVVVTGTPTTDDLFAIGAARSVFGTVVLISVSPTGVLPPVVPPGVVVVAVDLETPLAAAWRRAAAVTLRQPARYR